MLILIVAVVIVTAIGIFMLFRNEYSYKSFMRASDAIHKYSRELIDNGKYDIRINYYDLMEKEYDDLYTHVLVWGKYVGIKDEYVDLLKPYFD